MLYGAEQLHQDAQQEWTMVAELSFALSHGATVTAAELEACLWAITYLRARMLDVESAALVAETWKPLDTRPFGVLKLSEYLE